MPEEATSGLTACMASFGFIHIRSQDQRYPGRQQRLPSKKGPQNMCRATEWKGKEQFSWGCCFWEEAVREDTGQQKIKGVQQKRERVQRDTVQVALSLGKVCQDGDSGCRVVEAR